MIIYGQAKLTYFPQPDDATQSVSHCPNCGLFIGQVVHVCYGTQFISASDAAALIDEVSNNQKTPGNNTLQEKRVRSRRDVQEKRRDLRQRKVMKR